MSDSPALPVAAEQKDKIRILHLIPADGIGGVEVAAKSMQGRGDLDCIFKLVFIEKSAPAGRKLASLLYILKSNWHAAQELSTFKPDIIVSSLWRSVPLALLLRVANRRSKLVYFLHASKAAHVMDKILSTTAVIFADEVWADSAATIERRGISDDKGRVISFVTGHLPAPARSYSGASFVSWGRLHHVKGYDVALRFIRCLNDSGVRATLDVYGPDNGEYDTLVSLSANLGLTDQVRFLGPVPREELFAGSTKYSFFLQLSRSEGMCMSAVEAMQLGLVPVTTAVGQMMHYVIPGSTGILVDPENMLDAVAQLKLADSDTALWQMYSRASIDHWAFHGLYADSVLGAAKDLLIGPINRP